MKVHRWAWISSHRHTGSRIHVEGFMAYYDAKKDSRVGSFAHAGFTAFVKGRFVLVGPPMLKPNNVPKSNNRL